jgi:hypothetical protein
LEKGVASQTRVGWFQIAYGRLAKEFVASLAAMDESSNPKASAKMHGKKLIRSIWDAFLQLWKQRNEAVHGITEQTRKEAQVNTMEMKVRQCYAQQHIMPINDRQRLFQMPEDEKLSEDPRKLRAWIKLAERIIKTNKLENKKLQGQRTMMDQYFKWHPPDQRLRHHPVERQQHRKQDLKPD